jgi:hypothetical protein
MLAALRGEISLSNVVGGTCAFQSVRMLLTQTLRNRGNLHAVFASLVSIIRGLKLSQMLRQHHLPQVVVLVIECHVCSVSA